MPPCLCSLSPAALAPLDPDCFVLMLGADSRSACAPGGSPAEELFDLPALHFQACPGFWRSQTFGSLHTAKAHRLAKELDLPMADAAGGWVGGGLGLSSFQEENTDIMTFSWRLSDCPHVSDFYCRCGVGI